VRSSDGIDPRGPSGRQASRLGIGVVVADAAGLVLASALRSQGHAVTGVAATTDDDVERATALLPGVPLLPRAEVLERSEVVLLTGPDHALADLVAALAASPGFQTGQLAVHTVLRLGTEVLRPAAAQGAIPLVISPLLELTGTSTDLPRLLGAPVAVTAAPVVLPIAQALAVELGGDPVVVAEADRAAFAAAIGHAADHVPVLVAQSLQVLRRLGIEDPGGVLAPLLAARTDRALAGDDEGTSWDPEGVASDLAALEEVAQDGDFAPDDPDRDVRTVLVTYRAVARAGVLRMLERGRLDTDQAEELMHLLGTAAPGGDRP
jgi:predicted short-subunit dehydrogenase-like oxidoreductase (DUF2520 family)